MNSALLALEFGHEGGLAAAQRFVLGLDVPTDQPLYELKRARRTSLRNFLMK